jgi:drug/metabolite transporter (DMT)-like permease
MHTLIAVVAALAAGLAFAAEGLLQQGAASHGPAGESAVAMLARLAKSKRWWAGGVAGASSYGFQALALSFGPLALVQPLVVSEVLFAVPASAKRHGVPLGLRGWLAVIAVGIGLTVGIVAAQPGEGNPLAPLSRWSWALGAVVVIATGATLLARRSSGPARASLFALAGATVLGAQSALYKTSITLLERDKIKVLTHWQAYALIFASFLGLYLVQRAYKAGPLAASMPVMDAVLPLMSIALGLGLFHETVRTTGWALAGASVGIVLLVVGIIVLDTSGAVRRQQQLEHKHQQRRLEQER